jgi:fatty acid amide hydrolase 2
LTTILNKNFEKSGILSLREAYLRRSVSPVEVVKSCISAIERHHGRLNAMIDRCFENAVHKASFAEQQFRGRDADSLPILTGIPFTVKSNIGVHGLTMDLGYIPWAGRKADGNAEVVQRMIDAGGIVLGVSNISELCFWHETHNNIHGRTSNPFSAWRTSGGSSGGEAALTSIGGNVFGIGTDIGGSVRIPAAYCGVFGHKPTTAIVSHAGQWPYSAEAGYEKLQEMDTVGFFSRNAEDLNVLMNLITMNQKPDIDMRSLKIGVLPKPTISRCQKVSRSQSKAVIDAADMMKSLGAVVEEIEGDVLLDAYHVWRTHLHLAAEGQVRRLYGLQAGKPSYLETVKMLLGLSHQTIPSVMLLVSEDFMMTKKNIENGLLVAERFREKWLSIFRKYDLVICPIQPTVAPLHRISVLFPFNFAMTAWVNTLGLPATAVPMGFDANGLPTAVQIVGRQQNDFITIAVAKALQKMLSSSVD